eukprot:scaffold31471_cov49-Phaeocystis_antarctica.AAC.1
MTRVRTPPRAPAQAAGRSEDAPDLAGEVRAVPSAHGARLERRGELCVRAPRLTAHLEGGELG